MTKPVNQYMIATLPPVRSTSYGGVTHHRWLIGKFIDGDSEPSTYYRVTAVPVAPDPKTPDKQGWSYVCDCPASQWCKHLDMIGEWLRKGPTRFRYYYDEKWGWCEYPKGWFEEDERPNKNQEVKHEQQ